MNYSTMHNLTCPICFDLMINPVVASDGQAFHEGCVKKHFENVGARSLVTNKPFVNRHLVKCRLLDEFIEGVIEGSDVYDQYIEGLEVGDVVNLGLGLSRVERSGKMVRLLGREKMGSIRAIHLLDMMNEGGTEGDILKFMINKYVVVNENFGGDTLLIRACKKEMQFVALGILDVENVDVNVLNREGNSALIYACCAGLNDVALKILV